MKSKLVQIVNNPPAMQGVIFLIVIQMEFAKRRGAHSISFMEQIGKIIGIGIPAHFGCLGNAV